MSLDKEETLNLLRKWAELEPVRCHQHETLGENYWWLGDGSGKKYILVEVSTDPHWVEYAAIEYALRKAVADHKWRSESVEYFDSPNKGYLIFKEYGANPITAIEKHHAIAFLSAYLKAFTETPPQ